jgi:hypothetical protein
MRARLLGKFAVAMAVVLSVGLAACSTGRTADTRRGVTGAASIAAARRRPDAPRNPAHAAQSAISLRDRDAGRLRRRHARDRQLDAVLGPESYQPGPNRNIWDRSGDFVEDQAIEAAQDTQRRI